MWIGPRPCPACTNSSRKSVPLRVLEMDFFGRSIIFVNAFAAQRSGVHPDDLGKSGWRTMVDDRSLIAVVNCRFDRPHRSAATG